MVPALSGCPAGASASKACTFLVNILSSNCQMFCKLIVLFLYMWAYVGIRVPCPAVVSTAHQHPLAQGGWSSPSGGLCTHVCRAHACSPLEDAPSRWSDDPPADLSSVSRGGITRADALACWLCPHICRRRRSIDSVPLERPYTHRTCCSAG